MKMEKEEFQFNVSKGEDYKTEFKENLSGIDKDIVAVSNAGLPEPRFEFGKFFTVVFDRPDWISEKATETREKTREKLISLIKENPATTISKMSDKLEITVKGVEWHLKMLKDKGIIKRIGPDKGGKWETNETK